MLRLALPFAALLALSVNAYAAGDVQATVDTRGRLLLTGDALGNDVQIGKSGPDGQLVVIGRNGTTVNGAAQFAAAGVKSIRATMGDGDDVLAMGGFRLKKSLRVDLGAGDDTLTLLRNTIGRRATLLGGPGDDTILAEGGTSFQRGVRIGTDGGDSAVTALPAVEPGAGDGNDLVRIADSFVYGRMRVLTGGGADRVELHRDGFTDAASLVIRTGDGDDWVEMVSCTFQGHVRVLTADGEDVIYAVTSRFRRPVKLNTGPLDDEIELERSTFDASLRVHGGTGANAVIFIGVNISGAGGSGGNDKYSWRFVVVHFFP